MSKRVNSEIINFKQSLDEYLTLKKVLEKYDLRLKKLRKIKGGFKLETDKGAYHLKLSRYGEKDVLFSYYATEHLYNKGFKHVTRFYKSQEGTPYVWEDGKIYFITNWLSGIECDISDIHIIERIVKLMAYFHLFARGFYPPGQISGVRQEWGSWKKRFADRLEQLKKIKSILKEKKHKERFDRRFLKHVDYFVEQGELAIKDLNCDYFYTLVEKAKRELHFCHRDFIPNNIVIGYESEINLIDFDNCAAEIQLDDLGKFMRRIKNMDIDKARFIIETYHKINPISAEDIKILAAYLRFPLEFWTTVRRHYENGRHSSRALKRIIESADAWESFVDILEITDFSYLKHIKPEIDLELLVEEIESEPPIDDYQISNSNIPEGKTINSAGNSDEIYTWGEIDFEANQQSDPTNEFSAALLKLEQDGVEPEEEFEFLAKTRIPILDILKEREVHLASDDFETEECLADEQIDNSLEQSVLTHERTSNEKLLYLLQPVIEPESEYVEPELTLVPPNDINHLDVTVFNIQQSQTDYETLITQEAAATKQAEQSTTKTEDSIDSLLKGASFDMDGEISFATDDRIDFSLGEFSIANDLPKEEMFDTDSTEFDQLFTAELDKKRAMMDLANFDPEEEYVEVVEEATRTDDEEIIQGGIDLNSETFERENSEHATEIPMVEDNNRELEETINRMDEILDTPSDADARSQEESDDFKVFFIKGEKEQLEKTVEEIERLFGEDRQKAIETILEKNKLEVDSCEDRIEPSQLTTYDENIIIPQIEKEERMASFVNADVEASDPIEKEAQDVTIDVDDYVTPAVELLKQQTKDVSAEQVNNPAKSTPSFAKGAIVWKKFPEPIGK